MSRRAPARQHRIHEPHADRILSEEEKHQMILAHAAKHSAHPQGWGIGYSIAIMASCLVVVSGWWLTLDSNVRRSLPTTSDQTWNEVKTGVEELKTRLHEIRVPVTAPSDHAQEIGTLLERMEQAKKEGEMQSAISHE